MSDAAPAPRTLLRIDGLGKSFPGVRALDDMRLELRAGEVLAVAGENGAGKSTMMKLLSGVYPLEEGTIELDGVAVRPASPRHAQELGIGIIHQEFNLMPDLTVAQNIFIGREPRIGGVFVDRRRLRGLARDLLERLGLPLDPDERVENLTVAAQQMVEIAKALSTDTARVLIMDEPTAALNDAEVETLHRLIERFVTPETGVIYISHRMDELKRIADRVTVIRDGRYVDTLDIRTATVQDVISRMVGREIDANQRPVGVRDDREVVLRVRGLETRELLRDVSFELRKGEILGLAGLMGAGRTEVARAIVGADRSTGRIELHGRPVRVANPAQASRLGIGYLSEDRKRYGLLLEQDVAANIALSSVRDRFSRAGFLSNRAMRAAAERQVETLRIKTPSVTQEVGNLSGGNQQKVVIAKWLERDCDVLIFDEPTRGIDVGAKEEIYDQLNALAAGGTSIIMISSELPEILRMSHRIVVMSGGRVTGELEAEGATQEAIMHLATENTDALTIDVPGSAERGAAA